MRDEDDDEVELTGSRMRITADKQAALQAAISADTGKPYEDCWDALCAYFEVWGLDESGTVLLEHECDAPFEGPRLWARLAPFVEAGDYLQWFKTFEHSTYRVVFDGLGGYRIVWGSLVFAEAEASPSPRDPMERVWWRPPVFPQRKPDRS